jgi:hypothetical protein
LVATIKSPVFSKVPRKGGTRIGINEFLSCPDVCGPHPSYKWMSQQGDKNTIDYLATRIVTPRNNCAIP